MLKVVEDQSQLRKDVRERMEQVLLLNYDYTYLGMVSWRKAVKLISKKKVEVLKYAEEVIRTVEIEFILPKVIKLLYFIQRVHKMSMTYSKRVVFVRDNHACVYCGGTERLTVDHVIPKARGGKTTFENTVACCFACNNKKGNKTLFESGMVLRKKPHAPTILEYILRHSKIKGTEIAEILSQLS